MSRVSVAGAFPIERTSGVNRTSGVDRTPGVGRTSRLEGGSPAGPSGLYPIFLLAIVATVTMLFAAFTAALLIRRSGSDWVPIQLPDIVWANALVILVSSALLETSKRSFRLGEQKSARVWLGLTGALGVIFLVGQLMTWSILSEQGVLLPTGPHAAFFYMLSAVHGAHVLGGLGALGWTLQRAFKGAYSAHQYGGVSHAAIYWHLVGAIWIYLLFLLRIA